MAERAPIGLEEQFFRFCQHRYNTAKRPGIEFRLSFEEWWAIWELSGRWSERGRGGEKYCMCRFGDVGHYSVGNVFIATNSENASNKGRSLFQPRELPIGVRTQRGKFYATKWVKNIQYHIGTFATPEMARDAYLNFSVQ